MATASHPELQLLWPRGGKPRIRTVSPLNYFLRLRPGGFLRQDWLMMGTYEETVYLIRLPA